MQLWKRMMDLTITRNLRLAFGAKIKNVAANGVETEIDLTELGTLDVVPGTATASKAVVLDASKGIATITSATVTTLTTNAITGGDSSVGVTGQAAAQGGVSHITGGASSTAANAGGAATMLGGAAGATGVGGAATVTGAVGGATSGVGGDATATGGAGTAGNSAGGVGSVTGGAGQGTGAGGKAKVTGGASGAGATGNGAHAEVTGGAAASTNGGGGSVVLTAGAKSGTGIPGAVFARSGVGAGTENNHWKTQAPVPADLADTAPTLTAVQMLAGILTGTPTTGRAYTLPTGTAMETGSPVDLATSDSFELTIINLAVGADDIITVTANTGFTIVGKATVQPADTATQVPSATFRCVRTASNTFVAYRLS